MNRFKNLIRRSFFISSLVAATSITNLDQAYAAAITITNYSQCGTASTNVAVPANTSTSIVLTNGTNSNGTFDLIGLTSSDNMFNITLAPGASIVLPVSAQSFARTAIIDCSPISGPVSLPGSLDDDLRQLTRDSVTSDLLNLFGNYGLPDEQSEELSIAEQHERDSRGSARSRERERNGPGSNRNIRPDEDAPDHQNEENETDNIPTSTLPDGSRDYGDLLPDFDELTPEEQELYQDEAEASGNPFFWNIAAVKIRIEKLRARRRELLQKADIKEEDVDYIKNGNGSSGVGYGSHSVIMVQDQIANARHAEAVDEAQERFRANGGTGNFDVHLHNVDMQLNNLETAQQQLESGQSVDMSRLGLSTQNYVPEAKRTVGQKAINQNFYFANSSTQTAAYGKFAGAFHFIKRDVNNIKGLSAWIRGEYSSNSSGSLSTGRDSNIFELAVGAKLRLNKRLAIGSALRISHSDSQTVGTGTSVKSNLVGIALFTDVLLPAEFQLQLTGAFERADNNVLNGGNTGDFSYHSHIFSASLKKVFRLHDTWTFTPHLAWSISHTKTGSYVDSANNHIESEDFDVSVLTFGGVLNGNIYDYSNPGGFEIRGISQIFANIGLKGTQFLQRADGTNNPSDTSFLQEEGGGPTLSAGLDVLFMNAVEASFGSSVTFASGEDPWSVFAELKVPTETITDALNDTKFQDSYLNLKGSFTDLPNGRSGWTVGGAFSTRF
ncbi:MAG: autotransporter outer membrane beta-barrel domain-containing protein [Hyphomicrobiales bacterium]